MAGGVDRGGAQGDRDVVEGLEALVGSLEEALLVLRDRDREAGVVGGVKKPFAEHDAGDGRGDEGGPGEEGAGEEEGEARREAREADGSHGAVGPALQGPGEDHHAGEDVADANQHEDAADPGGAPAEDVLEVEARVELPDVQAHVEEGAHDQKRARRGDGEDLPESREGVEASQRQVAGASFGREGFGDQDPDAEHGEQGDSRGDEKREGDGGGAQEPADGGSDHEAQAHAAAQVPEPLAPLLGCGGVGDVGEQGALIPRRQAVDDAAQKEHPQRAAHAQKSVADGRAQQAQEEDGLASEPVAQGTKEGGRQELAEGEDRHQRAHPAGDPVGGEVGAQEEGEEGHDEGHAHGVQDGDADDEVQVPMFHGFQGFKSVRGESPDRGSPTSMRPQQ